MRLCQRSFYLSSFKEGPEQIAREHPELIQVWSDKITGAEGELHYGRPLQFHQQAQRRNWAEAWSHLRVPTLILYGEYDWYESRAGHRLIERIVNRRDPGLARFETIPQTDHHFVLFESEAAAVSGTGGRIHARPAVEAMLEFLDAIAPSTAPRAP